METLRTAIEQHAEKVEGLTAETLSLAAQEGSGLVVTAVLDWEPGNEESRLLMDLGDRRVWSCPASQEAILSWLGDESVISIHPDEMPDTRLLADPEKSSTETTEFTEESQRDS